MDSNAVEMPDIGLVNDATGDGGVDNITQPHPIMSNNNNITIQQQQSLAAVPDVLLSLAKDNRYISEIASLLSQVLVPYASIFLLPTSSSGRNDRRPRSSISSTTTNNTTENIDDILEDDGQRFIDRIRPELNLVASIIVHSATFVYYTRNFGKDINSKVNNSKSSRNESIQRSLGMESLNLAYRYPESRNHSIASSSAYVSAKNDNNSTNNIIQSRIKKYLMSIIPVLRVNQWHQLLILQTVVPYIIQRVGRGGWSKDLGGIISSLMHQIVVALGIVRQPQITSINNRSDNNESRQEDQEEVVLLNNDRLRGAARRRLFNEQRQRMMSSSSSLGSNTNLETSMNEARNANNSIENSQTVSLHTNTAALERRLKKLSTLSWNVIKRISLAMSSLSHGAHSLHTTHNNSNTSVNLDRYTKMIKWFLKLHLAMFYWNGMYPTIAHRLARVKLRDDVVPYSSPIGSSSSYLPMSGAIVANRPTYKPIAVMILFQAFAALAQTTAEASIEVAHCIQVSFFRWRRRRRLQSQQYPQSNRRSLLDNGHNSTNSERAEYLDLIEERVPGIESAKCCSTKKKKKGREGTDTSDIIHPCGVCLNERVNPAAPLGCGHVFCWNCILHWVSNVRAECPLCRAATKPQDIIPLYNYP